MVIELAGEGMALTVSALAETVELELFLVVGYRGILRATNSVAFLLDRVDQDEDVAGRLEGIKVGPVSYLLSEVFVAAPQDGGEHLK